MKNILIGILVIAIIVLGYITIKPKAIVAPTVSETQTPWPETNQPNSSLIQPSENNTGVNNSIPKIICTLPNTNTSITDSDYQQGLIFLAQGPYCATLSGFTSNDTTYKNVTFNGVSKTWQDISLSIFNADISPDGKHLAYTASNTALSGPGPRSEEYVVADNIVGKGYAVIYGVQYSPDSAHLGYCADKDKNGAYIKVFDGIETSISKSDFVNCDTLFGWRKSLIGEGSAASGTSTSPDKSITIKTSFDDHGGQINCNMADCASTTTVIIGGTTKTYGPFSGFVSDTRFSPDNKHFAWIYRDNSGGGQVFIDGTANKKYDEIFNLAFSPDNKFLTYNARSGKTVYFASIPVN